MINEHIVKPLADQRQNQAFSELLKELDRVLHTESCRNRESDRITAVESALCAI